MSSSSIVNKLNLQRAAILFAGLATLILADRLYETLRSHVPHQQVYEQVVLPDGPGIVLSFSCTDFSCTHQHGRNENFWHTLFAAGYASKLIRDCIFDWEHVFILSRKQAWFTHSAYIFRLSPYWRPSIPIAHRKLII